MLVTTCNIPIFVTQNPKMKTIFLVLAISSSAFVVFGASTGSADSQDSMTDVIKARCFKFSHSKHAFEALVKADRNYQQCANEAFHGRPPHPVEEHDEFCRYFDNGYYTCMKNFAINMLPCLDKTEVFLPHMILKAYNTTFNKLCGAFGLFETEYIFNKIDNNKQCLNEAMMKIVKEKKCIENLNVYKNFEQHIIDLNKHDYCTDMESFVSCATGIIEQTCTDDFTLLISEVSNLFLDVCK